jgi:glycosyltransferase involved in cell wall biosynthesis
MSLCHTMIVKNEAHILQRCFDSVHPRPDCGLVVDTGSTDGTQDIVRAHGYELVERPWKNFSHNRNEARELAIGKATHVLHLDADDVLEGTLPTELTRDCYQIRVLHDNIEYLRPHVYRPEKYRYIGVTHEYLDAVPDSLLEGVVLRIGKDGARSKGARKFIEDIELLQTEPDNARSVFYLAQSYRDIGLFDHAIAAYERRVGMTGFYEEAFISLLEIAKMRPSEEAFLRAYKNRPLRAEPFYFLARWLRLQGRFEPAVVYADLARKMPKPSDILFIDSEVYAWRALDEFAVSASYTERKPEAIIANLELLQRAPEKERARITDNLRHAMSSTKMIGESVPL